MQGARWGWVAFIAAVGVLFAASSHDQTENKKVVNLLRQELSTTLTERDRLQTERNQALEQIEVLSAWSSTQEMELNQARHDIVKLQQEREKLRKEITSVSQERNQLQQIVAGLQLERSQTKRSVEQLRQGLHQLLSQTDAVASTLAAPAPGFAQIRFEEEVIDEEVHLPCWQHAAPQKNEADRP